MRRALAGGLALALLGAAACRDGGGQAGTESGGLSAPGWLSPGPPTLLQLGQHRFSAEEFGLYRDGISRLITDAGPLGAVENTIILNQFVENRLLLVAAQEAGLAVSDADRQTARRTLGLDQEKGVDLGDEEILIQKFLQARFAGKIAVTAAEAEEYYNRHAGEYVCPTRYHVREILVDDPALARQIHEELQGGGISRFGSFAGQFSKAPSAEAQGDLGFFEKGQLPPDFEKIILALKPGRISGVVQTPYGFHIFYLVETVRSHPQKLYEVKDRILDALRMEKERSLQAQLLAELSRRHPPRVFKKALDFQPDLNTLSQLIVLEAANEK
jgi:peptidyl-prolyl cis-trans isomerase C